MTETLEIRPVRVEEADHVGDLAVRAYLAEGDFPNLAGYSEKLRDVAGRARVATVLVAALDGRVVGTVTWCPLGSTAREIARPGEGEFRMLAVWPAAQGRGVGEALVRACEERAIAEGDHSMVLSTGVWMHAAHRLYKTMGYARLAERDWVPAPGVQLWAYHKPLNNY